jgi:hypothetical protein
LLTSLHLFHARSHTLAPIHGDNALKAGPHAAVNAAGMVLACVSKRRDTVRVQRRRNCFALKRTKAFSVEKYFQPDICRWGAGLINSHGAC